MSDPCDYKKQIAKLEFVCDQLRTEIDHIDQLMHAIGFSGGLQTLKFAAEEIVAKGKQISDI